MPRSKPEISLPVPQPAPTLSRWGRAQRTFAAHLATAAFTAVLAYGLAAEDAHRAIAAERSTYQQLAVYAGCAHVDQVGNFSWTDFPQAMAENGEPIKVAAKAKRGPRK